MVQPIERAGRPRQNTKKTKQNKTTACAYIYMEKTNTNKRKKKCGREYWFRAVQSRQTGAAMKRPISTKVLLPSGRAGRRPRPASSGRPNLRPTDPVGSSASVDNVVRCRPSRRRDAIASRRQRHPPPTGRPGQRLRPQQRQWTKSATMFGWWCWATDHLPRCLIGRHRPAVRLRQVRHTFKY